MAKKIEEKTNEDRVKIKIHSVKENKTMEVYEDDFEKEKAYFKNSGHSSWDWKVVE